MRPDKAPDKQGNLGAALSAPASHPKEEVNDMTPEEMEKLIEEQSKQITDLTAERDSLKAENDSMRDAAKKTAEELRKTKELNFTLARTLDSGGSKKTLEQTLAEAFK